MCGLYTERLAYVTQRDGKITSCPPRHTDPDCRRIFLKTDFDRTDDNFDIVTVGIMDFSQCSIDARRSSQQHI